MTGKQTFWCWVGVSFLASSMLTLFGHTDVWVWITASILGFGAGKAAERWDAESR